jgi:hypothetical protein
MIDILNQESDSVMFFYNDVGYFAIIEEQSITTQEPKAFSGLNDKTSYDTVDEKQILISDCYRYSKTGRHMKTIKASLEIQEALFKKLNQR